MNQRTEVEDCTQIIIPEGVMIRLRMSGKQMLSVSKKENEYTTLIQKALPIEISRMFDTIRKNVQNKINAVTLAGIGGYRFCTYSNYSSIAKLVEDAKYNGIGTNNYSMNAIINNIMDQKDIINERAKQFGASNLITDRESLHNRVSIKLDVIQPSFSTGDKIIDDACMDTVSDLSKNMTKDLSERIKTLMAPITTLNRQLKANESVAITYQKKKTILDKLKEIKNLNPGFDSIDTQLNMAEILINNTQTTKNTTKNKPIITTVDTNNHLNPPTPPKRPRIKPNDPFSAEDVGCIT